jgi:ubiquinol-cytochrome c reductase iron-sulfur subunit
MSSEDIDTERRRFLVAATTLMGGVGLAATAIPFIASWLPSAKAEAAGAPVEVDISELKPGQQIIVQWRGKPVWVIHRTPEMLNTLKTDFNVLRDPDSNTDQQPAYAHNQYRSIRPEILVLIGICTHLGCSPTYKPTVGELGSNWEGGFLCPCHGSLYDLAGRVFKDVPAPLNLEVPPYTFINEHTLLIGVDYKPTAVSANAV